MATRQEDSFSAPVRPVILAAGRSSRMGFPKALAAVGGRPALARILEMCRLARLLPPRVVLGFHAEEIRKKIDLTEVEVCINPDPERGQTSSLQVGLAQEDPAVLLFPVDHAALRAETLPVLLAAWQGRPTQSNIALPSDGHRRGHPVVFDAAVIAEFRALSPDQPAHQVIRADSTRVLHVPIDDPAAFRSLNHPQDLDSVQ